MKIGNLTLKRLFTADGSGIKYSRMYFILIVIIVLISGLYLRFAWKRYQDAASSEVIMLAQSLESLLHPDHIAELTGSVDDLEKPEYQMTKTSLMQLTETTNPICYAYIMGIQNDSIIFLLDSQSPHSPNYSPPGQIYTEANNTDWEPFKSSSTVLTKPTTDRWGTWISALVPIKDPSDDRVIAVLGIDYSVLNWYLQLWKQMIPDVIIVICLLMLFFTIVRLLKDITIRKKQRRL